MPYNAFISYSHAADGKLAPALQSALHRFAKPWYQLRALRIFRDKTSLALTPALWPSIEKALNESRYFLLLASPDAANSHWVRREVDHWLTHASSDRGRGTEVITACEQAVAQAAGKDKDRFRGARELARAQTGDYAGAAEDLKAFMETLKGFVTYAERAPTIQAWISELEAGCNPFGSQTLQALRNDPLF